jgi:hypothetical protein
MIKALFLIIISILVLGCFLVADTPPINACITQGQTIEITYDDLTGLHKQAVLVGADYGLLPENNGSYACMGQCGGGCTETGPWLAACLSHDICSFNNKSKGFVFDDNCGDEAAQAALSLFTHKVFSCPNQ